MPASFAATVGSFCLCPICDPKPHVGGPIVPIGQRTVLLGGVPAAIDGDTAICAGPPGNKIKGGSKSVYINGELACRMGDSTGHNGVILGGCMTVLIG